jgi:ABC-2 type transport system ATP-binding protein
MPVGSVYGILGPNGSGKTTLLSIMAGSTFADEGIIRLLDDFPVNRPLSRICTLIGEASLWPHLSVIDNMHCCRGVFGTDETDTELIDLLETAGLNQQDFSRRFRDCSTGMRQKPGIVFWTLLGDPALLILDEPTNGLDPQGIADVRELILSLGESRTKNGYHRSVLLDSHLLSEVEQL